MLKFYAEADLRRMVERPVIPNVLAWWRDEFRKMIRAKGWGAKPGRGGGKAPGKRETRGMSIHDCEHTPRCATTWDHGTLVQAERSGNPEYVEAVRRVNAKRGGVH